MYHKVVLKQRVSLETSLKLGGQLESIASVQVKPFSGDELPVFFHTPQKFNIDIKHDGLEDVSPASNMGYLGYQC